VKIFAVFRRDAFIAAALFLAAFALYARTLAPSVAFIFDDTLDFQYTIPRLGIPHQTGYPLYTLLGKIFTLLVPLNDAAFRLNLFSALCAALAVAILYATLRQITHHRIPALLGATIFAVSPTFWSHALIAEVYALQMLLSVLVFYFALNLQPVIASEAKQSPNRDKGIASSQNSLLAMTPRSTLYALAFVMGLGLAHHRLVLLLYPAIAYYVLRTTPAHFRDIKTVSRAILLFLAPLLLYAYLPLRGAIGSADGTYENSLQGFLAWVFASQYTVFLTQNPLGIERDAAFYFSLFQNQFTVAGLVLAAMGFLALLARRRSEGRMLTLALIPSAAFAFAYRVADADVFFLSTFLLLAIFVGAGADALVAQSAKLKAKSEKLKIALGAFSFLLVALPSQLLITNYQLLDLSTKWDVHDYGIDILSQPLESNATIIGILGEMTLLRYFQENANLRADVPTIAADREDARLAAIDRARAQNRVVYLTRPLKGIEHKYSLSSVGPLIRVHEPIRKPVLNEVKDPKSEIRNFVDAEMGASIKLLGYDLDDARLRAIPDKWHAENGRVLRVTLYWQVRAVMPTDAFISLKILQGTRLAGQIDTRPVRDAYPTTAWRVGEIIADTYDVPVVAGAPAGEYILNVTLYDPNSGTVIAQRDLQTITLAP